MPARRTLKKLLVIVAALFSAGFIALNVVAYRQAYTMTHFTRQDPHNIPRPSLLKILICGRDLPRPQSHELPKMLGPDARSLVITETNGVRLGAWYCPASSPASPLVIVFHGYNAGKSAMLTEAAVFQELGFSVLLVDFRGSGESSEDYTTVGQAEAEDVAAAVHFSQTSLPHPKLVLYGISMGAASILGAVHRFGVQADAIIAEAVFDRMLATIRHRFELMRLPSFPAAQLLVFWGGRQFGFDGFANNPVDYAASVRCPILFLHGADDRDAYPGEARQVCNAVPGSKRFKEFAGIGHAAIAGRYRAEWKATIRQFLFDAKIL